VDDYTSDAFALSFPTRMLKLIINRACWQFPHRTFPSYHLSHSLLSPIFTTMALQMKAVVVTPEKKVAVQFIPIPFLPHLGPHQSHRRRAKPN
jgi:hypothetical protein